MNALIWSLVAIAVAPALERAMARWPALASAADGLAAIVVLATVLLHSLPYALSELGGLAALVAVAGLLLPPLCEVSSPRLLGTIVVAGLGAHALVDGALLAAPDDHDAGQALAQAIAVHTVPVSLAIWRAALPHGLRVGVGLLTLTAVAELAGWIGARALLDSSGPVLALLQCFTAGTLLHFAFAATPTSPRGSALGVVLGLAIAWSMTMSHPMPEGAPGELGALASAFGLAIAAAPATLAALLIGGALGGGRGRRREILTVGALGAALSLPLLGPAHAALVVACAGIGATWSHRQAPPEPWALRLPPVARLREALDQHLGWLLIGVGAAALLEPLLAPSALTAQLGLVVALGCVGLGLMVPASVVGLVPLVAVLEHKTLVPGAIFAVLAAPVLGAALDLPAQIAVRGQLHAARAGLLAAAGLLAGAATLGLLAALLDVRARPLHAVLEASPGPASLLALGLLAALAADALTRQGLPGLMPPLLRGHDHGAHGFEHPHAHAHGAEHHEHGPGCSAQEPGV